ncbi:OLC1v1035257C2 [Oldenlandia corymbosa var. corymbosa]|uniref:OLC1v1035257C2 n=1 Tax=Oldenlandia corymbosa var. corymbosa TaxID=529605 RepID=A0AAV1CTV3_OLDCO|nr:OLC1v1035257C2 [Oldenlandia corymbosa var. corymbosa]
MHLWPSMKMRDSFKVDYLKQLEWSLRLLKLDKQRKQQEQQDSNTGSSSDPNDENGCQERLLSSDFENPSKAGGKFIAICREVFLIITCCYCCFGCGG